MQPNSNRNEHWFAAFSDTSRNSLRCSSRRFCAHKIHNDSRDGRTPFLFLLGASNASAVFVFGESVFTMIPDHEVMAGELTNRWISCCWWRLDALSDEHLVGTNFGLLECRSVRRQTPGEQWSRSRDGWVHVALRGILRWRWSTRIAGTTKTG